MNVYFNASAFSNKKTFKLNFDILMIVVGLTL